MMFRANPSKGRPIFADMRRVVILIAAFLAGCAGPIPRFESAAVPTELAPRVSTIVQQIQCEIIGAVKDADLGPLMTGQFVATADLTLDVTDKDDVNPSLSFIHPLNTANTNFTLGVSGQYSREQHRNLHLTFAVLVEPNAPGSKICDQRGTIGTRLEGNLGIKEIMKAGVPYLVKPETAGSPYLMQTIGIADLKGAGTAKADPPGFGTTVDFTLVYGVGGGPSWTLTHFTGIGGSNGLVNFSRTNKDTLVLAFAKVVRSGANAPSASPPGAAADDPEIDAAVRSAQGQLTRQILNRLVNNR
jgi:hypothetical protein